MPENTLQHRPLAERMRPTRRDDFVGQQHLVGQGKFLKQLIDSGKVPSLVFWRPPGSGKTTLATILAHAVSANFVFFSAVLSGVKEIRNADIQTTGSLPVPLHIRNAPTTLMKEIGYGRGYQYAHDDREGLVLQEHLPPELAHSTFYEPTNPGFEAVIKDRLTKWKQILKQRAQQHAQPQHLQKK